MTSALVIIDMQQAMQHRIEAGRPHVNGDAPATIEALAEAFRGAGRPVIHIRHAEADPTSPLHPDAPGYPPMACAVERPGEAIFDVTMGLLAADFAELRDSGAVLAGLG